MRLKLTRGHALKLKTSTRLPAQFVGGTGMTVTRANGVYTIDMDVDEVVDVLEPTVLDRANHTGTQLSSTISDLATTISSALAAEAVTSIAGNVGAFTVSTGITNSTNDIRLDRGQLPGETTNGSASAGNIGEYIESNIAIGSAVSLTSPNASNVTSISLTAGDWDVSANVTYNPNAATNFTLAFHSISQTSATQDSTTGGGYMIYRFPAGNVPVSNFNVGSVGPVRKNLSGTTTIYLVAQSTFTISTMSVYGILRARRVR